MIKDPSEVRFGDGGYSVDEGDVLPLADGFEFSENQEVGDDMPELGQNPTQQEKLAFVRDYYGFMPSSAMELAYIIGIHRSRGQDAGKYISNIMKHQLKLDLGDNMVVPRSAHAIAADFIAFRDDARPNVTFLSELPFSLDDAVQDNANIADVFKNNDEGTRRVLGEMLRHREVNAFTNSSRTDKKFPFGERKNYMGRTDELMDGSSLAEIRDLASEALIEQGYRNMYWAEKIREFKKVTTLHALAQLALGERE